MKCWKTCKDEALLIGRDAFLVLDFGLDHIDSVGRLHLEGDGLARELIHQHKDTACNRAEHHQVSTSAAVKQVTREPPDAGAHASSPNSKLDALKPRCNHPRCPAATRCRTELVHGPMPTSPLASRIPRLCEAPDRQPQPTRIDGKMNSKIAVRRVPRPWRAAPTSRATTCVVRAAPGGMGGAGAPF